MWDTRGKEKRGEFSPLPLPPAHTTSCPGLLLCHMLPAVSGWSLHGCVLDQLCLPEWISQVFCHEMKQLTNTGTSTKQP